MTSVTTMTGHRLRLVSWNVKGMNNSVKAGKVLLHFQHLKADIMFLQETHLRTADLLRIKRAWMGHLYHSKFSQRARGAAIIIHRKVMFEETHTISDPNGRFVVVSGKLHNLPVILVSVYAPNWDNDEFFVKFFSSLPNVDDHHIIIGGDFNLVQDVSLDRSSSKQSFLSKSAKVVLDYAFRLGLSDPWRVKYPQDKVFSFFSHVHHTFSRIDFFLLDNKLLNCVNACTYHTVVISDHAPVSIDVVLFPGRFTPPTWRFDSSRLSDDKFKDFVASQINLYFDLNQTPDINSLTLWEAFKAFIRGQVISYVSYLRKTETVRLSSIADDLYKLDASYASSPSPSLYTKRVQLQAEYDLLMTNITARQLRQCRQCWV